MEVDRPRWTLFVDEVSVFLVAFIYTFIATFLVFPIVFYVGGQIAVQYFNGPSWAQLWSAFQGATFMITVMYFFGAYLAMKAILPGFLSGALLFVTLYGFLRRSRDQHFSALVAFPAAAATGAFVGTAFEVTRFAPFVRWQAEFATSLAPLVAIAALIIGYLVAKKLWRREKFNV